MQESNPVNRRGRYGVGRDVVPSPYSNRLSDALERIHGPSTNNNTVVIQRLYGLTLVRRPKIGQSPH